MKKILLVDDTIPNLKLLGNMLQETYSLSFATSGAEALKLLEKMTPDLVLLDIMMPGMDGFEVCRRIKGNPVLKEIPVLFITAKADKESLTKSFELGGEGYILKPFEIEEVMNKIDKVLPQTSQVEKETQNKETMLLSPLFSNNRIRNNKYYFDYFKSGVCGGLNDLEAKMEEIVSSLTPLIEQIQDQHIAESIRAVCEDLQNVQFQIADKAAGISEGPLSSSHNDFTPGLLINDLLSAFPGNIEFHEEKSGNPIMRGAEKYFIQLIVSLVDNAFQAAHSRNIMPLVKISLSRSKNDVTLTLQDNGEGFLETDAHRLTEPFFSTQQNNMGLGLTVAELLVKDEFKGRMTLENHENGCRVHITFPNQQGGLSGSESPDRPL